LLIREVTVLLFLSLFPPSPSIDSFKVNEHFLVNSPADNAGKAAEDVMKRLRKLFLKIAKDTTQELETRYKTGDRATQPLGKTDSL
jgi:hypothetical protein|tara:strand:- start:1934 stop:2191 length:258 start_codon:yes stop_codon:yes gene_type:complete